jgi:signal transduction histidine kinase
VKKQRDNRTRQRPIRKRLTAAVLIPSVTLVIMWALTSAYLLAGGYRDRMVAVSVHEVSVPAVRALAAVQRERQLSMTYLGRPTSGLADLRAQQQQTDQAVATMRGAVATAADLAPVGVSRRVRRLNDALDQLPRERAQIGSGAVDRNEVFTFYNGLLDAGTDLFDAQARMLPSGSATRGGLELTALFRATDQMSRATSVAAGAFASGTLTPQDHLAFATLVGGYRAALDQAAPHLRPGVRSRYRAVLSGEAARRLTEAENAIIGFGPWPGPGQPIIPVNQVDWQGATNQVSAQLTDLTVAQADEASTLALANDTNRLVATLAGSVVALLAAIAVIIAALRMSRAMVDRALVTRLVALKNEALALAHERLPGIVRRLRMSEPVDVAAELPALDYGDDEVGQLAQAFNAAQTAAASATVQQAQARDGVHHVFLGIAHRNQGLVHRQLELLDEMERDEEDPALLERLFRLDHLATRARRNAENLIILGGRQPGRRWHRPIRLFDVLRAAVSETEQYTRVRVDGVPDVSLVGSAVADAVHLVAELVDNATAFSPPESEVRVTGTVAANGVVIEVEDRGLGMSEEDRAQANAMLAEAPDFAAMALRGDARLGLFVVARLAARLDIRVELRPSPYGGIRAIVLVPTQLMATEVYSNGSADTESLLPRRTRQSGAVRSTASAHAAAGGTEPATNGTATNGAATNGAVPVAGPQPVEAPGDVADLPPLPRRKPRQNLLPQSPAEAIDEADGEAHRAAADEDDRSAERVRHTLSAFLRGSREARQAGKAAEE